MYLIKYESVTRKEKSIIHTICDCCGDVIPDSLCALHRLAIDDKDSDGYDNYGESECVDLCKKCVVTKVVPALISVGIKFNLNEDKGYFSGPPRERITGS